MDRAPGDLYRAGPFNPSVLDVLNEGSAALLSAPEQLHHFPDDLRLSGHDVPLPRLHHRIGPGHPRAVHVAHHEAALRKTNLVQHLPHHRSVLPDAHLRDVKRPHGVLQRPHTAGQNGVDRQERAGPPWIDHRVDEPGVGVARLGVGPHHGVEVRVRALADHAHGEVGEWVVRHPRQHVGPFRTGLLEDVRQRRVALDDRRHMLVGNFLAPVGVAFDDDDVVAALVEKLRRAEADLAAAGNDDAEVFSGNAHEASGSR